jgi:DNA-binding GntR family transcriptional regulator
MISVAEKDGFADTINKVCGNSIKKSVQRQFESTVFSRIRTKDTFSEDECITNLQSIIEACVASEMQEAVALLPMG